MANENEMGLADIIVGQATGTPTAAGTRRKTQGIMSQQAGLMDTSEDLEIPEYVQTMLSEIRETRSPMERGGDEIEGYLSDVENEEALKGARPQDYADVVYTKTSLEKSDVDYSRMASGLREAAAELGMSPVVLATIVSYETAGTFSPTKGGPKTKWGKHRGLIQFGESQAKTHGVDWSDPYGSQLGAKGAIVKYFKKSGYKPGMGLLDAYSIVNAGAPGLYNRSDTAAGGAPGTVRDKVNKQMAGHKAKARRLMEKY